MKKLYTSFILALLSTSMSFATMITITTSGFTFSPSMPSAVVGDSVTLLATTNHPFVEVADTTYANDGNFPLATGWGIKTSTYVFKITAATNIYFVCNKHHATFSMKGMIMVSPSGINNVVSTASFNVFPNPALIGDEFTISVNGIAGKKQLSFYNMTGQMLQSVSVSDYDKKITVDLAAGTYYCVVQPENSREIYRRKVVVLQ